MWTRSVQSNGCITLLTTASSSSTPATCSNISGDIEVFDVVSEWYRVLAPGGHAASRRARLRHRHTDYYLEHGDIRDVLGLIMGGQTTAYDYHKVIFDETSLGELLADVGFRSIQRYDWRETDHAWLDDFSQAYLPHMDKDGGTLVSLNVEAIK